MKRFPFRLDLFILLGAIAAWLLGAVSCASLNSFVESAGPYHTDTYERVCNEWSREARIHRGLEVDLIASATFKSEEFRKAYADEFAEAYRLTPEKKKRFVEDQLEAAADGHEFLIASFVPEEKWDDFDKANSMWKLYLVNDQNERLVPLEVRRIRRRDPVTPHFFPYITPWKSIFKVRFPRKVPITDRPIVDENTESITLVITSVLGSTEMSWKLK